MCGFVNTIHMQLLGIPLAALTEHQLQPFCNFRIINQRGLWNEWTSVKYRKKQTNSLS